MSSTRARRLRPRARPAPRGRCRPSMRALPSPRANAPTGAPRSIAAALEHGGMRARRATPSRPPRSRSRPAPELVARGGRLDQPPDQPAAAERERWEHVRAAIAPHPGRGRGLVVRLLLRKTPYPSRHPNPPGRGYLRSGRRMSRSSSNFAAAVPGLVVQAVLFLLQGRILHLCSLDHRQGRAPPTTIGYTRAPGTTGPASRSRERVAGPPKGDASRADHVPCGAPRPARARRTVRGVSDRG